jgi:hypothetical protein
MHGKIGGKENAPDGDGCSDKAVKAMNKAIGILMDGAISAEPSSTGVWYSLINSMLYSLRPKL